MDHVIDFAEPLSDLAGIEPETLLKAGQKKNQKKRGIWIKRLRESRFHGASAETKLKIRWPSELPGVQLWGSILSPGRHPSWKGWKISLARNFEIQTYLNNCTHQTNPGNQIHIPFKKLCDSSDTTSSENEFVDLNYRWYILNTISTHTVDQATLRYIDNEGVMKVQMERELRILTSRPIGFLQQLKGTAQRSGLGLESLQLK